jgi:hypothetical protein
LVVILIWILKSQFLKMTFVYPLSWWQDE